MSLLLGFPGGPVVKNSSANAEDLGSTARLGRSLEKERATHSSILACEIPWTKKPGELQLWGQKRVGYDLATKQKTNNL